MPRNFFNSTFPTAFPVLEASRKSPPTLRQSLVSPRRKAVLIWIVYCHSLHRCIVRANCSGSSRRLLISLSLRWNNKKSEVEMETKKEILWIYEYFHFNWSSALCAIVKSIKRAFIRHNGFQWKVRRRAQRERTIFGSPELEALRLRLPTRLAIDITQSRTISDSETISLSASKALEVLLLPFCVNRVVSSFWESGWLRRLDTRIAGWYHVMDSMFVFPRHVDCL